jgi:hypothetical protein
MAGAVDVDLEGYDVADALVVDRGEDGVAGGEGQAVEVVEGGGLEGLPGGGRYRHAADRRVALGGDAHVDRGQSGRRRTPRALEFPLLFAAESSHRSLTRVGQKENGRKWAKQWTS